MFKISKKKIIVIPLIIIFLMATGLGVFVFYYNNFGRYKQVRIIVENDPFEYYIKIPKETSEQDIEVLEHLIGCNVQMAKLVKYGVYNDAVYEKAKKISQQDVTLDNYKSIINFENQEAKKIMDACLSNLSEIGMIFLTTSQKNYIPFYRNICKNQAIIEIYGNEALCQSLYISEDVFANFVEHYNLRNEIIEKYNIE